MFGACSRRDWFRQSRTSCDCTGLKLGSPPWVSCMGRPFTQSFTKPSSAAAALAALCPELFFSAPLAGEPPPAALLSPRVPSPVAVPAPPVLPFAAEAFAAAAAAPKPPGLPPPPDVGDAAAQLAVGDAAGPVLVEAGSTGDGSSAGTAASRGGAADPAPAADGGGLPAVGEFPIGGAFAAGWPRFAKSPGPPLPDLGPPGLPAVDPRLAIAAQLMQPPPPAAFPSAGPVPVPLLPPDADVGVCGDGAGTVADALACSSECLPIALFTGASESWGAAAGAGIAGAAVAGCCTVAPCAIGSTAPSGSSGAAAVVVTGAARGAGAVGAAGAGAVAAAGVAAAIVGAAVGGAAATAVTAGCVETIGAAIFGAAVMGVAMAAVPVEVMGLMEPSCTDAGGGCPGCARLGCPMPAWDRSPCCGASPCCGGRASYSL
mmetsp:Transcript_118640/g.205118  ORF Transcript_118640/g.205118 Transcript_118640/m.205118 type:complete len:431 (-) Transcript_118640:579-1871(-)